MLVPKENKDAIRWIGNIFGVLGFAVSLPLIPWFWALKERAGFQFVEGSPNNWIPSIGAGYVIGIDGISFLLIMLTTLLGAISILSSWNAIQERVKEYYVWFLVLQTGMLGVFMANDMFLFFVFWEAMLVPMYLLIGIWGGPRKLYAAIKFFLYTLFGSVLMLLGILFLYFHHHTLTGVYTFYLPDLYATAPKIGGPRGHLAVLRLLRRLRHQGADVPVPHLAAGRARRGANRRLGHPGGRPAEDGNVRAHPLLAAVLPGSCDDALGAPVRHRALADRHHLRRAGLADAEGHEEAGGVLVGQPPRLLHPRHLRAQPAGPERLGAATDQPRHLHRRAVLDCRHSLRDDGTRARSPSTAASPT